MLNALVGDLIDKAVVVHEIVELLHPGLALRLESDLLLAGASERCLGWIWWGRLRLGPLRGKRKRLNGPLRHPPEIGGKRGLATLQHGGEPQPSLFVALPRVVRHLAL